MGEMIAQSDMIVRDSYTEREREKKGGGGYGKEGGVLVPAPAPAQRVHPWRPSSQVGLEPA